MQCCGGSSDAGNYEPGKQGLSATEKKGTSTDLVTYDEDAFSKGYFEREKDELDRIARERSGGTNMKDFKFSSGAVYKGQWLNHMRHGFGTQTWPDGSCYSGEWKANVAVGKGQLRHRDGERYIGQWKNNKANGMGTYYYKHSVTGPRMYRGTWKDDLQEGRGVEEYFEWSEFQGNFSHGYKDGPGVFICTDGATYAGQWTENNISGRGKYTTEGTAGKPGRCYMGQWRSNVLNGIGKYTWPDGKMYCGEYRFDNKDGFGIFTWPDGRKVEGFWQGGKQVGNGRYTTEDGQTKTDVPWYVVVPASANKAGHVTDTLKNSAQ